MAHFNVRKYCIYFDINVTNEMFNFCNFLLLFRVFWYTIYYLYGMRTVLNLKLKNHFHYAQLKQLKTKLRSKAKFRKLKKK